jgi:T5SS/PEP-CTERM-associated repeat protein
MSITRFGSIGRRIGGAPSGALLLLAYHLASGSASADTSTWSVGVGNWTYDNNWYGGVPHQFDVAAINNGGTAQIIADSVIHGANELDLGDFFGFGSPSSGTLEVLGGQVAFATFNDPQGTHPGDIYVGEQGKGTLSITGGGLLHSYGSGTIGNQSGSAGTVTVDGVGSHWYDGNPDQIGGDPYGDLSVGELGTGALRLTGGGAVSSLSGEIGHQSGSTGTATVDGVGSSWSDSGDLTVGSSGTGTLSITGGTVSNFNANMGYAANGSGTATVSGAGSKWTNNSVLAVGVYGTGGLSITGGGVVTSTNGRIAREALSGGIVFIDGPGSKWSCSSTLTMGLSGTGTATLSVTNGGVVSADSGLSIGPLGTVLGDGTIVASVDNSGVVAPGATIGTLHVIGNYTQNGGGKLQIDLASPTSFDKLAIGTVNNFASVTLGGTLEVSLEGGYVPHGSQSFNILSWTGIRTGTFSSLVLPTLGGTLVWNTSQLYTAGVLSVVGPAAIPGDYNGNGIVDAADYTVWRDTLGSMSDLRANGDNTGASAGKIDQADFNVWKANFGTHAGSGSGASAAVPEPPTLWMLLAGILTICCRRRAH